ncbi:MAG: spore protease YyaC [Lachnospiraceae bacterium]|jgi:putative sporulation protein YyaC|nr:spore protease YyaC [Lachnospiraceae bacterium]
MWSEIKQLAARRPAYYHQAGEQFSPQIFGRQLAAFVDRVRAEKEKKGVLFLCIGSDRSTGDSLGPLVGYKLERLEEDTEKTAASCESCVFSGCEKEGIARELLGTLSSPVHAVNLEETMKRIREEYQDYVVVAIDASIGRHEHVGYITVGLGSLKPGLGVRKNLGAVGDVFITGIVGSGGAWEPLLLQNTRLAVVMELADCICEGICAYYALCA